MLSKEIIQRVLQVALVSGGDFAEIFVEDRLKNRITLMAGKVDSLVTGNDYGVGIRVFKGIKSMYVYTNDDSLSNLIACAKKAAKAIDSVEDDTIKTLNLIEKIPCNMHPILSVPSSVETAHKIKKMKIAYNAAKDYSSEIVQVTVNLIEDDQKILIANSEGLLTRDRRIRSRIAVTAVASDGKDNQVGMQSPGAKKGFELLEQLDLERLGKEAATSAVTMLHAPYCEAGKMPVAIENGFGGVIFHEACGHALESSAVAKGDSIFANKLGEQIASTKVTAIDDGTLANEWGSINIDDEGNAGQKNILIENGILKSYMIDRLGARRMNMQATGSGRRESYKYAPTSRMTNTYIAPGNDEDEAIINSIGYGLYAKQMGGGSVNPVTGDFNFAVLEGYMIKNGKIDTPVRGASLIGNGAKILMDIDMVGKNLAYGQGMCGAASGSVPTNVGQPLIRVREITVGGR